MHENQYEALFFDMRFTMKERSATCCLKRAVFFMYFWLVFQPG